MAFACLFTICMNFSLASKHTKWFQRIIIIFNFIQRNSRRIYLIPPSFEYRQIAELNVGTSVCIIHYSVLFKNTHSNFIDQKIILFWWRGDDTHNKELRCYILFFNFLPECMKQNFKSKTQTDCQFSSIRNYLVEFHQDGASINRMKLIRKRSGKIWNVSGS